MDAERFIARKMGSGGESLGKLGRISNNIGWISVAVSIAVMIIAVAVVGGFKREISQKATGFMGSVLLVAPGQAPTNQDYPFTDSLSYRPVLDSLKWVRSVSGVAYRSGLVKTEDNIGGVIFKGVDSLYDFSFFEDAMVEGSIPDFRGRIGNEVLVSKRLSDEMGFKVGDDMTAYFISDEVRARKFTVCGLFDAQLDDIDKTFVIVDRRHVQRLNGWGGRQVSSIEIHTDYGMDLDRARSRIEEIEFSQADESDPGLFVVSVKKLYAHLFDWLALLDLNVLMILALMIAVAGFNMISAVLIILFEKISTIGLLKSLGMSNREVGKVFRIRTASIVGKGLQWGNVLALGICLVQKYTKVMKLDPENYFVKFVPIELDWLEILLLDVISAAVIMLILRLTTIFISRVSPDRTMRVE